MADDNAIPQGAVIGAPPVDTSQTPGVQSTMQSPDQGDDNSIPQGAVIGAPPSGGDDPSGQFNVDNSNDSTGTKFLKGANAMGGGMGESLLHGINGAENFLGLHVTGDDTMQQREQELKNDNSNNPTLRKAGYGGESLMELMTGDELFKGLSLSQQLLQSGKIMKMLESSPKLINLLKIGANASKAIGTLGPEEQALIQKYPLLSKYVAAGMDAMRMGAVQGAQTTARTDGTRSQRLTAGAEDAATQAGIGTVLGGVTGTVAHALGKGADAAGTIADMTQTAEKAPTATEVSNKLGNLVAGAPSNDKAAAEAALHGSTSDLRDFGATPPKDITATAQKQMKAAEKDMHSRYQQGVNDISGLLKDQQMDYEGSPLHKAAQSLSEQGESEGKPLDTAFSQTRPGSTRANKMVDLLSDPNADEDAAAGEVGADGTKPDTWVDANGVTHTEAPVPAEDKPPIKLDINELIDRRQQLGERLRKTGWATGEDRADRATYGTLLKGVDDSIASLADQSGSPEAIERLKQINQDYKTTLGHVNNKDVQSMLQGNSNDVSARLMRGETSLDDINSVHRLMGDQNFHALGVDSMQKMVADSVDPATGDPDYQKLFKTFSRIKPDVRDAMFGKFSSDTLYNTLSTATNASDKLDDINKTVADLMGNGKIDSLIGDPQRVQHLASVVGPDGMKALGQSVMANKIAEASTSIDPQTGAITKKNFNPDHVLDWWTSMKDSPEVRDSLFTVDAASRKNYNDLIAKLHSASSVKKLVKYGVIAPTLTAAGSAGGAVAGPIVGLLGGVAALGGGLTAGKDLLDAIANSPKTWKFLSRVGNAANSKVVTAASKAARTEAGSASGPAMRNVYNSVFDSLGGK